MISVCVSHNRVSCIHLAFLRFEFDSVVVRVVLAVGIQDLQASGDCHGL